jgi:urease accessory protein
MLGFVLATALLHAAGMALGASIHRLGSTYGTVGAGLVGSLITAAGVGMLAGVI